MKIPRASRCKCRYVHGGAASCRSRAMSFILCRAAGYWSRRRALRDFTTRTHNAGHHRVELIVNGEVLARGGFDLEL